MASTSDALSQAESYAYEAAGNADETRIAATAALAQAFATIAVAEELRALRGSLDRVTDALKDHDGHDIGMNMRAISDSLEKVADRS